MSDDTILPDSSTSGAPRSGRRGRGGDTAQLIVISWRDIPAQVNAQRGREREQYILSAKFQRAIDRAKRKGKIYTAHEDIAQWARVSRPCGDDLAAEARAEAERLEAAYSTEHLGRLGFLGGWEPHNKPADEVLYEDDDLEDDEEEGEPDAAADWGTWSTDAATAAAMQNEAMQIEAATQATATRENTAGTEAAPKDTP